MTTLKVLIPLDGSPFSQQILPSVCRLFPPQNVSLVLLRVEEEPVGVVSLPPRMIPVSRMYIPMYETRWDADLARRPIDARQSEESLRASVEHELREAARELAGYDVSVAVRFGAPADEILRFVECEAVDLVAMATHGHTGMRRLVLGSVAEQALHELAVPVLLLRPTVRNAERDAVGHSLATTS